MPAKQHDFTATEIKAGILVLASVAVLVGFLLAIRGCGPGEGEAKVYYAVFTDIAGLNRGADVRFGGVRVGRVTAIEPDPESRAHIRVTAEVGSEVPVNRGSVASIEQVTLTTEKHLEISTGVDGQPLHESGDTLRSSAAGGVFDIPDVGGVITRMETMLDGINALLGVDADQEDEEVDLGEVLASLKTTLDEGAEVARGASTVIEENRDGFNQIVTRLAALEKTANALTAELHEVIVENRSSIQGSFENLENLTEELTTRLDELVTTLETTLGYIEDFGGNSSDLMDQQRPTIEEMLLNLQEATRNLKEFSRILAEQPDALIRGKGQQGRRGGEEK